MKRIPLTFALLAALALPAFAEDSRSHDTELQALRGAKRLLFHTDAGASNFTSTAFTQVTGSGTIVIPAAWTGFFVATFTAESSCSGGGWCSVILRCDGVELQPAVGTDFAFSSGGGETFVSASVTRRSNAFTGGNHFCEVYTAVVAGATNHRLDDWTFNVEFWRQ